jgi:hypothetical protein
MRTVCSVWWVPESNAAAVWLDLCGSTPITTVNPVSSLPTSGNHGRHSDFRLVIHTPLLSQTAADARPSSKPPASQPNGRQQPHERA